MAKNILASLVSEESGSVPVTVEVSDSEWDHFVISDCKGHYDQTTLWAGIKDTIGWESTRIVIKEQQKITGGAQILFHRIPLLGRIGYVLRGPVYIAGRTDLPPTLMSLILKKAAEYHCQFLLVQPLHNSDNLIDTLFKMGFHESSLLPEYKSTLVLNLEPDPDQLISHMRRQSRKNIHISQRSGIVLREGTKEDLDIFYPLYLSTSQRNSFAPYPRSYIQTMWDTFNPGRHIQLLITEFEGRPVSGILLLCFGETVYAHILGWNGMFSEKKPNDSLYWGAMRWARANGYKNFDFGGVLYDGALAVLAGEPLPDPLKKTPDFMKYGYGGEVCLYPQAYDYIPGPFFNALYRSIISPFTQKIIGTGWFARFKKILMKNR